ncbi:IS5 family transposase [Streptomyces albogriseolus]|uniref:IS5 family transposase n=1 Tax=Streptomyces albogriseolus TaxID=1887 RepID=UPI0036948C4E
MGRGDLSDAEWAQLEPHLPTNVGRGGRWHCHRRVINGILFRLRTGLPWRDLPPHFGKWQTVYDRHRRWSADGTWEKVLRAILAAADAAGRIDWSVVSVGSTVCRAHQHAAGARHRPARVPGRRRRPAEHRSDEAIGRSRGGLTTKIHLASDGSRRPLSVLITPGQWGDAPQLITVLDRICVPRPAGGRPRMRPDHVCGDKAYSSHRNHADRCTSGTTWAKPPRSASTGTVVACAPCQNGLMNERRRRRRPRRRPGRRATGSPNAPAPSTRPSTRFWTPATASGPLPVSSA